MQRRARGRLAIERGRCGASYLWRGVQRSLDFERPDVDASVHDSRKTDTALIVIGRPHERGVTRVDGRAAGQQRMGERRAAVVLQWTELRIGVDLVGSAVVRTCSVAAQVIPERSNRAGDVLDVRARNAGIQYGVHDFK